MGSSGIDGEMCMEAGGRVGRRGGKKAAEQKAAKQPQRGLGVAQLEKIRMQNQMIAAYRSGMPPSPPTHQQHQVPFPASVPTAGHASFQPYLTGCFDAMDRRIADAQYSQYCAENLLPYGSSRPPATSPLFVVHDSPPSSHRQQQPPQYHNWMRPSHESSGRGNAGGTEELDLELRL
ncbi:protein SPEAR3-like [Lolium rigidum]|uniref:protein SPEAR3-like n=1 Tax=Lolium rigidum TaxID=89674 RepID=UPI001F5E1A56|nr:protein SPEAR3-like [Lolium rigidum]